MMFLINGIKEWEMHLIETDEAEAERMRIEAEHEQPFADEELNFIYPWCEDICIYRYPEMGDVTPNLVTPDEEEFNDLFAEAVFTGAISIEPADGGTIRNQWLSRFNKDADKAIKELKELIAKKAKQVGYNVDITKEPFKSLFGLFWKDKSDIKNMTIITKLLSDGALSEQELCVKSGLPISELRLLLGRLSDDGLIEHNGKLIWLISKATKEIILLSQAI